MRKHRVIKIKNSDCKEPSIMLQNYTGLWRTLRVKAALNNPYGIIVKMGNTSYKLET